MTGIGAIEGDIWWATTTWAGFSSGTADLEHGLLSNAVREGSGEPILRSQVVSWLGDGPNAQVTDTQVTAEVGVQELAVIGERTGAAPEAVAGHLAEQLPVLIDTISPQGTITDDSALIQQAVTAFGETAPYDTPVKLLIGDQEYTSAMPQARIGMAAVRPAEFIILQFTQDVGQG